MKFISVLKCHFQFTYTPCDADGAPSKQLYSFSCYKMKTFRYILTFSSIYKFHPFAVLDVNGKTRETVVWQKCLHYFFLITKFFHTHKLYQFFNRISSYVQPNFPFKKINSSPNSHRMTKYFPN